MCFAITTALCRNEHPDIDTMMSAPPIATQFQADRCPFLLPARTWMAYSACCSSCSGWIHRIHSESLCHHFCSVCPNAPFIMGRYASLSSLSKFSPSSAPAHPNGRKAATHSLSPAPSLMPEGIILPVWLPPCSSRASPLWPWRAQRKQAAAQDVHR